jgi:hypothetical protein
LLSVKARALLPAALVALSISSSSFGALRTTNPATSATVLVVITDKGIKLTTFTETANNGGVQLNAVRGAIPRGFYLHFTILNKGKRMHNFEIFGRKTQVLRPAQRGHFNVLAKSRGNFVYESTLDKHPAFRGHLTVF